MNNRILRDVLEIPIYGTRMSSSQSDTIFHDLACLHSCSSWHASCDERGAHHPIGSEAGAMRMLGELSWDFISSTNLRGHGQAWQEPQQAPSLSWRLFGVGVVFKLKPSGPASLCRST